MRPRPFATLVTLFVGASLFLHADEKRPPEFWQSIAAHDYALPEGASVVALSRELSTLLGSPDPRLRDEVAYSTLTAWIYEKRLIPPDALRSLMAEWLGNLKSGIGSEGTDAVLRRSFSALMLSVLVARDNAAPFLEAAECRSLLDAALAYLEAERDVRGYDADKGWIHSAAHTADLLKFLARNRSLERADQQRILDAIVKKLSTSAVLAYGEDERFARTVLSVINRKDFDQDSFKAWLARAKPGPLGSAPPSPSALHGRQNVKNLLAKLEVLLSLEPKPSDSQAVARDAVRATIQGLY